MGKLYYAGILASVPLLLVLGEASVEPLLTGLGAEPLWPEMAEVISRAEPSGWSLLAALAFALAFLWLIDLMERESRGREGRWRE